MRFFSSFEIFDKTIKIYGTRINADAADEKELIMLAEGSRIDHFTAGRMRLRKARLYHILISLTLRLMSIWF